MAVGPTFTRLFQPVLDALSFMAQGKVYDPPYGLHVIVPAYITYVEPVTAALVVAALVWDRLSAHTVLRVAQFVLLLMLMDLSLFRTAIYGFYDPAGFWAGLKSQGQFWLEDLILALGTAANWALLGSNVPRNISVGLRHSHKTLPPHGSV